MLWRVQRATPAVAVLVARRKDDDGILLLCSQSGEVHLPTKQLNAWIPVATQVEEWQGQLLQQASDPVLVAVDGSPGKAGVTFLYAAEIEGIAARRYGELWIDLQVASPRLTERENHMLRLYMSRR